VGAYREKDHYDETFGIGIPGISELRRRVHLQMILKCIYTVIGKDSQVGRRRSTGHEAMLIRFDVRLY